jgi:hypothetical protein
MSDADRTNLAYDEETAYGVPDTGSGIYKKIRYTAESLSQENSTVRSAEIRADRQTTDVIRTDVSVSGSIDFEFSGLNTSDAGVFDDWIIAALLAAEDTDATNFRAGTRVASGTTTFTFTAASDKIEDPATAGTAFTAFAVGDWIQIAGAEDAPNNRIWKIKTKDASNDFITVVPTGVVVDETSDAGITLDLLPSVVNGTNLRTYTVQREYEDLTTTFSRIAGLAIDQWAMNVATEAVITGSFTFVGSTEVSAAADLDSGTKVEPPDTQVLNPVDHVDDVFEDEASFGVTSWTMALANNLRRRLQVSTLGAISLGTGQVQISGTLQSYFATVTHSDKFLNHTTTSLALVFQDDNSRGYIIDLPAVKLSAGARVAGGQNTDVINDMGYEAFRDATEGVTIRVVKIPD